MSLIYLCSFGVLLAILMQFGAGAAESVVRTPLSGCNISIAAAGSAAAGADLVLVSGAAASVADTSTPAGPFAVYGDTEVLDTKEQPNLPARASNGVASLAGPGLLVEFDSVVARSH